MGVEPPTKRSLQLLQVASADWRIKTKSDSAFYKIAGACNYHGLYGSNKLLYSYKRCFKSLGMPKIRPPQLPHFRPIVLKLKTKEDIRDMTPRKKWLTWGDRKGACENVQILAYF